MRHAESMFWYCSDIFGRGLAVLQCACERLTNLDDFFLVVSVNAAEQVVAHSLSP